MKFSLQKRSLFARGDRSGERLTESFFTRCGMTSTPSLVCWHAQTHFRHGLGWSENDGELGASSGGETGAGGFLDPRRRRARDSAVEQTERNYDCWCRIGSTCTVRSAAAWEGSDFYMGVFYVAEQFVHQGTS